MSTPTRDHSFDGIQEFDNRLPNWWLWSFYLACIFSVGYWIHYHTLATGSLPPAAYVQEQRDAAARIEALMAANPVSEEMLLKLSREPGVVEQGAKIFKQNCALCHKEDATGNIGPNLTDGYWLHGGKPMQIWQTVTEGKPDKGMQPWKWNGALFVQRAVAYVLTIKNTNLPGKEPQGTKEQ